MPYTIKNKNRPAKKPKPVNCQCCRFKCEQQVSEDQRKTLCASYWKLSDFVRQKDFLLSRIKCSTPERRRQRTAERAPRKNSKQYYFEINGQSIRVCQVFFLKTLCITNDVILNAFKHRGETGTYIGEDKRGKHEPGNKTSPNMVADVKAHIESFPTMESHYSRQCTSREYLDSTLTISKMYELYKTKCDTEGKESVSLITYKRIFGTEYNLSFFKPKKDLCQTCETYLKASQDERHSLQENYESHQRRKAECNAAKAFDKERAQNEQQFVSLTFDLQSVLQIPSSDVSAMYYSRKVCAYNFTIYESAPPNNAFCFCWTELNGKRGSSEIGSCLFQYLKNLPQNVTEVSMFSDTCGGQNRNKNVAALLLYTVQATHLKTVEHKFLESGHTFMEVDSMHSAIERAKRCIPVYTMQDWLSIFRVARSKRLRNKTSAPYTIKEMTFTDFVNLQDLSNTLIRNRTKDSSGQQVNWLLVKSFRFSKEKPGVIDFKYDHSSEYRSIQVFGKGRPPALPKQLAKLYKSQLPISSQKKKDLLNLCRTGAIPQEFHGWYKQLPISAEAMDLVPEPSVYDNTSESDTEVQ